MKLLTFFISYYMIAIIQYIQLCQAQECSKPVVEISQPIDLKGIEMDTFEPKPIAQGQTIHDFLMYYLPEHIVELEDPISGTDDIANPNFEFDIPDGTVDTKKDLFGIEIDATNFTLRFYKLLIPKISGYYTFSVSADDAAMVSIMNDFTYMCCKNITFDYSSISGGNLAQVAHGFSMEAYQNYSNIIEYTGSPSDTREVTLYLKADSLVQIDMVVINRGGNAKFDLSITDPDGNSVVGQPGYFYDSDGASAHCQRITEVIETADVVATTTYSSKTLTSLANVFGLPEYNTVYYVQVPSEVPITSSSVPEPSSSTVESSSEITSDISSTTVSSSIESSVISSPIVETSTESSSEVPSSIESSSTESTVELSSTVSSIEPSSTIVSSITESSDSSIYTESSTGSLSSYSSNMVTSSETSQLTSSNILSSSISQQTTSSAVISTEITSSERYSSKQYISSNVESKYTNSSSIEPSSTRKTSVITTDTSETKTNTYDSEIISKTTVTLPCSSDKCNTPAPVSSTKHITSSTHYYTTTVTTLCSVTHPNSVEVTISTYTTIIESVITHPVCSGNCPDNSIHVSQTGPLVPISEASSTSHPQVLTSSTTHLVDINENNGIHFSSSIVVLFISLLSILTIF